MTDRPGFQRAYSAQHKAQRANDLMEAARTLATREGVRGVTLTAIAQHAGVHVSAVRRYYASREEILLTLAEEGYEDWSQAVAAHLAGRTGLASADLAGILVATLVERPLLCDLFTHVTLSLEREVTYERVRAFKRTAVHAVGVVTEAVAEAGALGRASSGELVTATIALTAPLWQAGHPGENLTRLYREEPGMAHVGIDFEPTLTRLLTALCDGLTGKESPLEAADREV
ncbi:TetR/AcrR family transcriptional regulator [Streptomyces sp. GC420]|uniref:TetR/AcrR family transcriptional regulator n=1 Tax=Streptomyces sp. GC420 TaxID=2697568 RepID=UPI0014151615|nr:TetR family transcriptional regulator [Streptomyces sp. GC420]NBM17628.1 TetR family transcriptional regulator [Streptomyces sp. GC420]